MKPDRPFCIQGGTVVLPDRCVRGGTVLLARGRIAHAGERRATPRGATLIKAGGLVVTPGLIDLHIHGGGPYTFDALDAEGFASAARFLASRGVLRFVPTMMAAERVIARIASNLDAPSLRGICPGLYIEGPFISMDRRGGIQPHYVSNVNLHLLRRLHRLSRGHLRMMTFAPEVKHADRLLKEMRRLGILPCVGHTNASAAEIAKICRTSRMSFTHLFNAMSGLDHKRPGAAAFALDAPGAWVELNPDGVHVAPELLRLVARAKHPGRIILITDAVVYSGRSLYMGRKAVTSAGAVHYASDGTLIGSRLTLNQGVARYMKLTGAPLHEAICAASLNPAALLGIASRTGSLQRGKLGDVVVFTPGLKKVTAAFRNGVPVGV